MADITTTQREESMNNLMKGYMDAMTSLTTFLKPFELVLEQRKEATKFIKYQENNKSIKLVTSSPYEKQASEWCKDPNEQALIKTYRMFYNTSITISQQVNSINIEEDNDYEYLLKHTCRKVQDIVNTKSEMAKSFYISFDKILQEEIKAHVSGKKSISLTKNQIKNLPTIKSKEPNLQYTNKILEIDNIEENIDFISNNFQSSFKDCSIKENIQTRSTPTSEDRLTFCEIHQAEITIVPNGIQKDELFDIINRKTNSYYYDFALKICNEMGSRKASTLIALMAHFEFLRVLVPETALHLISQNKSGLELELAQEIMEDSANFAMNDNQEVNKSEIGAMLLLTYDQMEIDENDARRKKKRKITPNTTVDTSMPLEI
ncbi:19974_t:CDS:2 [Gigaspora margarita]|uniref:19974_t:CDS:1 n=1 Tax=Gigaspora margarita TaxID=4874 RepID=A0ABN7V8M3_GIGMA|nr:19974_t:CDS:2 [Gigaspora margarita]